MGVEEQVFKEAEQDYKDRNQSGEVVILEHVSYKRLDDGRWYVWAIGLEQWIKDDKSDVIEMGYQVGLAIASSS